MARARCRCHPMDCYATCVECPRCGHWSLDPGIGCERRRCAYVEVALVTPAQRRAAERGTAAQREAATAMQTPPTLPVAAQSWEQLKAEVPSLAGWVTDHAAEADALIERIKIGSGRRTEAIQAGDTEALEAIERRLAELSTAMAGMDHGARRLSAVRGLLYLRDLLGPTCEVHVTVSDCSLNIRVGAQS